MPNWTINDSKHLYQVPRWGDGYFDICDEGDLCVSPTKNPKGPKINIRKVIEEVKKEGLTFPAVIRFHDILRNQIRHLNQQFHKTIREAGYRGSYAGVYPVKVNQLREVIEEVVDVGNEFNYGLEAGSKPELLAALAYNTNPEALTILNGYKDREYLKLAMLGCQMGRKVVIVIEKFSEIFPVLEVAQSMQAQPIIGVRAKLNSKSGGKWAESSGDFAKFGLSIPEIVQLVELLREKEKLSWLKLFHFHAGSQIPDIRTIKDCLTEGARIYTNLVSMGVPLRYFDAGGGVGINYDGSKSASSSSTNYSLEDYIGDVVYNLKEICDLEDIEHPDIVTETGRAVAAHHSCLITNVFGEVNLTKYNQVPFSHSEHHIVKGIKELYEELTETNYQDIYNDACVIKDEAISAFKLGILNLEERSTVETLYWNICHKVLHMTEDMEYVPSEIHKLRSILADKYLCNFSLFQSAPDIWAIEQILPVVPISQHTEKPTRECTMADITCDSDGKINHFLSPQGQRSTLPIHKLNGEDYYIGVFLTGAYQDVMGDMHNLFGRLNEIHVFCDDDDPSDFYIEEIIKGNNCADVLRIMQYTPEEMSRRVKSVVDQRVKTGELKPRQGVKLCDLYDHTLGSYTYLT